MGTNRSASDGTQPIGVALVGLGMVGPVIADAVHRLGDRVALRGVLSRSEVSARRFLDQQASIVDSDSDTGCKIYTSIHEVAADPSVTMVLIATPPDVRDETVSVLAAAGKHLLIEKPLERNLAAATAIVEQAERAGVRMGVFLQHRAKPATLELAELIASGSLGQLAMVEVSVPWWRPQVYYDQPGRGTYARDGGGVLLTQAIHTIDLMLSLAGPVQRVSAMTATTSLHNMESEDFATAGMRFASGAVGQLMATTAAYPGRPERLILHHTKGTAELRGDLLRVRWHDGRVDESGTPAATGSGVNPMAFSSDWHLAILTDMVDAIADDRPPLVTGRDALGVHRLIDAIERSAATQAEVDV